MIWFQKFESSLQFLFFFHTHNKLMALQNQFLNLQDNIQRLLGNLNIPNPLPINNPQQFIQIPINLNQDDQLFAIRLINLHQNINHYIPFIEQNPNRNQLDANIIVQLREHLNNILQILNNQNIRIVNN
jgi:hypothetical protein